MFYLFIYFFLKIDKLIFLESKVWANKISPPPPRVDLHGL